MSNGMQIQVMARSATARFNMKQFVTVRIRCLRTITVQTRVLPITLIRKIIAEKNSLKILNSTLSADDKLTSSDVELPKSFEEFPLKLMFIKLSASM